MGQINIEQINAAYEMARLVHASSTSSNLTAAEGARRLHAANMINEGTAKIYIRAFRELTRGTDQKRSLSTVRREYTFNAFWMIMVWPLLRGHSKRPGGMYST